MTTLTVSPIQQGVPVPGRSHVLYSEIRKKLVRMKVGDYREFDSPRHRTVAATLITTAKRMGMKVITRKLNGTGIGAWRIA